MQARWQTPDLKRGTVKLVKVTPKKNGKEHWSDAALVRRGQLSPTHIAQNMQATSGEVQDMERERVAGEGEEAGEDEENSLLAGSRTESWEAVDQAMQESPKGGGGWVPMEGVEGMCRCDYGSRLPSAWQIETRGIEEVVGC